jgi:hypothetical protein
MVLMSLVVVMWMSLDGARVNVEFVVIEALHQATVGGSGRIMREVVVFKKVRNIFFFFVCLINKNTFLHFLQKFRSFSQFFSLKQKSKFRNP